MSLFFVVKDSLPISLFSGRFLAGATWSMIMNYKARKEKIP